MTYKMINYLKTISYDFTNDLIDQFQVFHGGAILDAREEQK